MTNLQRCPDCGGDGDYLSPDGEYLDAEGNPLPDDAEDCAPCPRCHGTGAVQRAPDFVYIPVSLGFVADPRFWETVLPILEDHLRRHGYLTRVNPQDCRVTNHNPETGEDGLPRNQAYVLYAPRGADDQKQY